MSCGSKSACAARSSSATSRPSARSRRADGFAYCTSEPILARGTVVVVPPGAAAGSIPIFVNQGDVLPTNAAFRPLYAPFKANYKFGKILPNVGFVYNFDGPISVVRQLRQGLLGAAHRQSLSRPVVDIESGRDRRVRPRRALHDEQDPGAGGGLEDRLLEPDRQFVQPGPRHLARPQRRQGEQLGHRRQRRVRPTPSCRCWRWPATSRPNSRMTSRSAARGGSAARGPKLLRRRAADRNDNGITCAPTKGQMVTETPQWQFGGRAQYEIGPVEFGVQAKRVGSRFATDTTTSRSRATTSSTSTPGSTRTSSASRRPTSRSTSRTCSTASTSATSRRRSVRRQSELRGRQPADAVGDAQRRALRRLGTAQKGRRRLTFGWGAVFSSQDEALPAQRKGAPGLRF